MDTILLIDDEQAVLDGQKNLLSMHGFTNIEQALTASRARELMLQKDIALAILDLTLERESGFELLEHMTTSYPETIVLVVTGTSDIKTAVECMRAGAYDFLLKGSDASRIPAAVRNALEHRNVRLENARLRQAFVKPELEHPRAFSEFKTASEQMRRIFLYLEAVATLPDPILITGETGVGKEILAKAVHDASGLSGRFVAVNVGGLEDHVVSDTLFGHVRGAFTGADQSRAGLVREAAEGTLFLDEFAELSLESQVKLLRLLDSGEFLPLGADRAERASARIILATNRDLEAALAAGQFRSDLYYRISTHHVRIPPLRERPEDFMPILSHLVEYHSRRLGRDTVEAPPELVRRLAERRLPGNVRELHQLVMNAVLTGEWQGFRGAGPADQAPSPAAGHALGTGAPDRQQEEVLRPPHVAFGTPLPSPAEAVEALLREADRRYPNNRSRAAEAIGLSPQAFANRLRRLSEDETG